MSLALAGLLLGALETMATTKPQAITRPAKDEWGVYDPQQAGLAALYARLDTMPVPPAPVVKKDLTDYPAPAAPIFRDE